MGGFIFSTFLSTCAAFEAWHFCALFLTFTSKTNARTAKTCKQLTAQREKKKEINNHEEKNKTSISKTAILIVCSELVHKSQQKQKRDKKRWGGEQASQVQKQSLKKCAAKKKNYGNKPTDKRVGGIKTTANKAKSWAGDLVRLLWLT